jgi:hypothetical protein
MQLELILNYVSVSNTFHQYKQYMIFYGTLTANSISEHNSPVHFKDQLHLNEHPVLFKDLSEGEPATFDKSASYKRGDIDNFEKRPFQRSDDPFFKDNSSHLKKQPTLVITRIIKREAIPIRTFPNEFSHRASPFSFEDMLKRQAVADLGNILSALSNNPEVSGNPFLSNAPYPSNHSQAFGVPRPSNPATYASEPSPIKNIKQSKSRHYIKKLFSVIVLILFMSVVATVAYEFGRKSVQE